MALGHKIDIHSYYRHVGINIYRLEAPFPPPQNTRNNILKLVPSKLVTCRKKEVEDLFKAV